MTTTSIILSAGSSVAPSAERTAVPALLSQDQKLQKLALFALRHNDTEGAMCWISQIRNYKLWGDTILDGSAAHAGFARNGCHLKVKAKRGTATLVLFDDRPQGQVRKYLQAVVFPGPSSANRSVLDVQYYESGVLKRSMSSH
jgi:hypothetical protein